MTRRRALEIRPGRLVLIVVAVTALLLLSVGQRAPARADVTGTLQADQYASGWGDNSYGQLGNNSTTASSVPIEVTNTGPLNGKTVTAVSSGGTFMNADAAHTCAVTADGGAYCWGNNEFGQLGDDSTDSSSVPVAVDTSGILAGKMITGIAAGGQHTCAVTSDGGAYCWGRNNAGQLGNDSTDDSSAPVAVATGGALDGQTVTQVTAGVYDYSCALTAAGAVFCWGFNGNGQLGDGTQDNTSVPAPVDTSGALSGKTVTQISAGAQHTCAVASDGGAHCWGFNGGGRLGVSSLSPFRALSPTTVYAGGALNGKTVVQISAGDSHTCSVTSDGGAYCWGANGEGQVGDGSTVTRIAPVAVTTSGPLNGKTVTQVSAGYIFSCARTSDGSGACWGANDLGQLGNGTTFGNSTVPEPVTSVTSPAGGARPLVGITASAGAPQSAAIYSFSRLPGSPSNLGMSGTTLSWTAPISGAPSYMVLYKPNAQSQWRVFARALPATSINVATYAANGCPSGATCPRAWGSLAAGTTYGWRVLGTNVYGNGRSSSSVTATFTP